MFGTNPALVVTSVRNPSGPRPLRLCLPVLLLVLPHFRLLADFLLDVVLIEPVACAGAGEPVGVRIGVVIHLRPIPGLAERSRLRVESDVR